MIFNIQRFSTHDGNGIRTIIFFKGCPLHCTWCSNPESQSFGVDVLFDRRKCIGCHECVEASLNGEFIPVNGTVAIQRGKLIHPLAFKDICPTKAITVTGENKRIEEIVEEVKKDLPFYKNSRGGVTVSGGEPFAQSDLLHDLLVELKRLEIHISAETCLHVAWEQIQRNAGYIDVFLADLKHIDSDKFKTYTGGNINLILSNLRQLETIGAEVIIRIPVIPGFNHSTDEMQAILDVAASFTNVSEVHFIPYHALGSNKYTLLGKKYELQASSLTEDEMEPYVKYAINKGLTPNVGG